MSRLTIALAAVFVLGLNSGAMAQEGGSSGGSAVLDTVVVTAGRSEEQLKSVSVPVTIITEEEMQRVNAQDLPDLLRHYGLQVNQLGAASGLTRVAIRGFATSTSPNNTGEVIVLLDGRKIGNNNIGMVSLQNIARVEVLRGPAAMQYGSSAVGGVINLISKRGQEKTALFFEQTLGSFNSSKTQAGFSGQLGKFDFSFGGSYLTADDYSVGKGTLHGKGDATNVPGGGIYKNSFIDGQEVMGANVGFQFNEDHRLGVGYSRYFSEQARSGDMRNGGVSAYPNGYGQRKNYSWDFLYEGQAPSVNLDWMTRAYTGNTRYTTASNWYSTPKAGYYDYGTDFDGLEAQVKWNIEDFYLTAGVERYTEDYWQINTPPYSSKFVDTAGYLMGKLSFLDEQLWLNAGVRYDSYESQGEGAPATEKRYTPAFGVAYSPVEWVKVRANYAGSFTMPTPDRLTGDSMSASFIRYLGNPNLKPQTAESWDFGADFYYHGLEAGLTYFSSDYKDLIRTKTLYSPSKPTADDPRVDTYENLAGTTKYRGLEANLSWAMGETFGWDFDIRPYVTLTKMLTYEKPDGTDLELVPGLSMSYGVSLDHPAYGFQASLDATYYGEELPSAGSTQWGGIRFGKDHIFDLHLSKMLYDWNDYGKVTLKGDILNLTNRFYHVSAGYPQPGRAFYVGLRYDY
jgi:vitamin B12 transporter